MKPLVVIPSYNERENLKGLLPSVLDIDPRLSALVIDDNSPDQTANLVQEQMDRFNDRLFLLSRPSRLGLASAYIEGFKWGLSRGFDFLVQMDADWSHSPAYLAKMLSLADHAELLIGSRYVDGGGVMNWSTFRSLLSRGGNFYARAVLGLSLRDLTGGFNGWHARVLESISLETISSNGYAFQIELKYRAVKLGIDILEFPIVFEERRAGQSKMSGKIIFEAVGKPWRIKFDRKLLPAVYQTATRANTKVSGSKK